MKKYFAILFSVFSLQVSAQTVSELFISMPEEETPLLTLNDKKEMIECWNQKLDTSVKNRLGGVSRIDTLAEDFIKVRLSAAKSLTLFRTTEGGEPRIGIITTLYSPDGESTLQWFDESFQKVTNGKMPKTEVPDKSDGLRLVEYVFDPEKKEVKVVYHYPMKGKEIS